MQFSHPPDDLLVSMEADIFSLSSPSHADFIDGSIGEGSTFHKTFGYYAHGVAEETAILPPAWKDRLITLRNENTAGAAGLCLEVHDLAISKLFARREKDLEFVRTLLRHPLTNSEILKTRLTSVTVAHDRMTEGLARLNQL